MQDKIPYQQIYLVLLAVLLALMIPVKHKSLKGAVNKASYPEFSMDAWLDGSWQEGVDDFLNQRFGFRPTFVRINNQLAYWFFNKAKANGVVIGKENYLFEQSYIDAYFGTDFIGQESIDQKLHKLKAVQDTLSKLNTELVVIFAAAKGSFYPEYIPDNLVREKGPRNFDYYLQQTKALGIQHIDFNSWLISQKDTSPYLLYPKTGIHWSTYAEILVVDSLLKHMEELKAVNVPSISWTEVEVVDDARFNDEDIEEGMNIFFDIEDEPFAYPAYFIEQQGRKKLRVLSVADSFWWGIYNQGIPQTAFADGSSFWFYAREAWPGAVNVKDLDFRSEIESADVIYLVASEPSLRSFAYGWVEKAYALYFP